MIKRVWLALLAIFATLALPQTAAFAQVAGEQLINNHGTQANYSTNYTATPGNDRVMLVIVFSEYDLDESSQVNTLRFGGVDMIPLGTIEGQRAKRNRMSAFYLPENQIPSGQRQLNIRYRPDASSSMVYISTLLNIDQTKLNVINPSFLRNCTNNGSARPGTINFAPIMADANDFVFSFVGTGENGTFTSFANGGEEFFDERVFNPGFSFAGAIQVPQFSTTIAGSANLTEGCQNRPSSLQLKFSPSGIGINGTVSTPGPVTAGDTVRIQLADADLNTRLAAADEVFVTITNDRTGESETILLIETGANTGIFEAQLPTDFERASGADDDGRMSVLGGDTLTTSYFDSRTDTNGSATRTAQVVISDGTLSAGTFSPLSCPVPLALFDWQSVSWTPGTTSTQIPFGNFGDLGFSITTPGEFFNGAAFGGLSPSRQNVLDGGTGEFALATIVTQSSRDDEVATTITLPRAAEGVQFSLFDVDFVAGQFADRVEVFGRLGGSRVSPSIANGSANEVVGDTIFGMANSVNGADTGNAVVTFNQPVDTIEIRFGHHGAAPANPGVQGIALHDISACFSALADLRVSKTSFIVADPINGTENPLAVPGALVEYLITIENFGNGPADTDSLIIRDDQPEDLKLCGLSGGSGPVAFADPTANSGLSYSFASLSSSSDDLEFSNNNAASFGYTPSPDSEGCDAAVTDLRVRPGGAMAGGTSITLRVQYAILD